MNKIIFYKLLKYRSLREQPPFTIVAFTMATEDNNECRQPNETIIVPYTAALGITVTFVPIIYFHKTLLPLIPLKSILLDHPHCIHFQNKHKKSLDINLTKVIHIIITRSMN